MAGIYLHIPFCRKACNYCNFHFSTSHRLLPDLVNAMRRELSLRRDYLGHQPVETVYLGGGTPSLLPAAQLTALLDAVRALFPVAADAELTLEANPDDVNEAGIAAWKAAGINRLSLGVQSFREADLQWMNRAHNAAQALRSIGLLQNAGLTNLSIDLIYGTPGLDDAAWQANVNQAIALGIPHLSAYALTVEPKTALAGSIEKGKVAAPAEEDAGRQFLLLMEWLEAAGYEHYEISNWALPGSRSRHNSSYWQGAHYLGIGPSAHSFNGHSRSWNIANNALYTKQIEAGLLPLETEILTPAQQANEYIMTSLRTSEGLHRAKLAALGFEVPAARVRHYLGLGWMEEKDGVLRLTKAGRLYADGVAADFFVG